MWNPSDSRASSTRLDLRPCACRESCRMSHDLVDVCVHSAQETCILKSTEYCTVFAVLYEYSMEKWTWDDLKSEQFDHLMHAAVRILIIIEGLEYLYYTVRNRAEGRQQPWGTSIPRFCVARNVLLLRKRIIRRVPSPYRHLVLCRTKHHETFLVWTDTKGPHCSLLSLIVVYCCVPILCWLSQLHHYSHLDSHHFHYYSYYDSQVTKKRLQHGSKRKKKTNETMGCKGSMRNCILDDLVFTDASFL